MPVKNLIDIKPIGFAPNAKQIMTSFDIKAIIKELESSAIGSKIENIYDLDPKTLLLSLHPVGGLLVESGRRLHLTRFQLDKPKVPSTFCANIRRLLRRGRITAIEVEGFERVVSFIISAGVDIYKLVIEIFGFGNILLLDPKNTILRALTYRRMRDRSILPGEKYRFPPSRGIDLSKVTEQDLLLARSQEGEVVRVLARILSLGSPYVEEILLRAGIEKTLPINNLGREEVNTIIKAIQSVKSDLLDMHPQIIADKDCRWLDVVPFNLSCYSGYIRYEFSTYNEAADVYFTHLSAELRNLKKVTEYKSRVEEYNRIITQQMERLKDLEAEVINSQRAAELLYAHLTDINSILEHLRKSSEKLEMDHQPASPYSSLIRSVNLKLGKVNVNLDGQDIELDFRKSIFENAKTYYERVKTAKAKIKGLKQALKEIEIKLKELEQTLTSGAESNQHPRFSKEKPWYEKFRWAKTDDDYLIIGGRDAISNELIIKKYTEPQDLVFHADVPGAPFVILKTMGKQASEESILLAAQMAASYSSAWKARSYSLDVFWVKAEQVSKRAPSGEFLMPGSFIIEGKKNYIRNVPLRVSIGIVCKDDELQIIGGPPGTVRNKTKIAIDIVPGHLRSGELAKELFRALTSQSGELRSRILKLPLVELQRFIPPGGGDIARK